MRTFELCMSVLTSDYCAFVSSLSNRLCSLEPAFCWIFIDVLDLLIHSALDGTTFYSTPRSTIHPLIHVLRCAVSQLRGARRCDRIFALPTCRDERWRAG